MVKEKLRIQIPKNSFDEDQVDVKLLSNTRIPRDDCNHQVIDSQISADDVS
jgi:hypothetical protein